MAKKGKKRSSVSIANKKVTDDQKGEEQIPLNVNEMPAGSWKRPRRAAACVQFKEKSVQFDEKSSLVEVKKDQVVEEELLAIRLTQGQEDGEQGRPNRRLTDFVVHDANGVPQPFEMIEVDDMFISGVVLALEECEGKEKDKYVRCQGFGRIEAWDISGYEDGLPVIWLTTEIADYDCVKPASSYKRIYDRFFEKARACVEVYKRLSKSSGGNPDITLDELLAGVVRSMSGNKLFSGASSVKAFLISQGEFIYKQLIGLDETSKINVQKFVELPVLAALRNESHNHGSFVLANVTNSCSTLTIGPKLGDGETNYCDSDSLKRNAAEEDEDMKLAKLLQEEEYWESTRKQKKNRISVSSSSTIYIKINEDEIANDYPLPAYYKHNDEETDEFMAVESYDTIYPEDLPKRMLHNWSLYNSDSRFISLELLPMKPCEDIDVSIFGSGNMTEDDGSGFSLENESDHSSRPQDDIGLPIFLSAIKEWVIEVGMSMIFISVRTDMAWYRLGKPSKQYASWYKPVLKTAKLALDIINLLKDQSRVSKLSFADVIRKMSELKKDDQAFISSDPVALERFVVVHGQIILQLFAEFPDKKIQKCAFVLGLTKKMEERHHTKWRVNKRNILQKNQANLNPRAAMGPLGLVTSKRKAMQATTTRLINRIWGEFYSNYSPEDSGKGINCEAKDEDEVEEREENEDDAEEQEPLVPDNVQEPYPTSVRTKSLSSAKEVRWIGHLTSTMSSGESLYKEALVHGETIAVGSTVLLETDDSELPAICYVEYMFETTDGSKMFHGRTMRRGCHTVLGNAANEREVFFTHECMDYEMQDVKQPVTVEIRKLPWGHNYRKENAVFDKTDRAKAEERKKKGLPLEYYCKSLYWPERGAFFSLPTNSMGLGSGNCQSCSGKQEQQEKGRFEVYSSRNGFLLRGIKYFVLDFVYLSPHQFTDEREVSETFKGGRNVGLKAYVVGQLLEIMGPKELNKESVQSTKVKVQRFYRPQDISSEKAYYSDIREVYYSEETHDLPIEMIRGKCEVRKRSDIPVCNAPVILDHIFFCEHLYDASTGSLKQLPAQVKLRYSTASGGSNAAARKRKGKCKEGENNSEDDKDREASQRKCLATLDIFAGCGGLSEGLRQAGVVSTKWAIEYEEPAGEAFKLNHPESLVFVNNCNVILKAVMEKCGDTDDCISTPEANELAASLDEKVINDLPLPGQVDFINGGPPCQGFSGMNRFNTGTWSKVQCEMILAFLSFADYFRPKYFLLENVRNFVSFNKGQTFRLTLASLLEMGYQVRFGILEAGTYGVSQSRKRVFIWAASPEEILPEWPEPMHVFAVPELKITLSGNSQYAAVRSTADGAPFRAITVRDTIGDLPSVGNGASKPDLEYKNDPASWFQKKIRGNCAVLHDHISKEMNELNIIRCQKIPKRPGADWRDLPDEKIKLSTGQVVDLIPWCLPNTAKRHNQWKGLFGRLDWEGNFPTSITDPQPMGKVGMCFHPEQDRIVTVRECARSQGFPDSYQFAGNIQHKHRQIGNAVPPPLAYALGTKLKEALESKRPRE